MTFHQKPNLFVTNVEIKVSNIENSIRFYTEIIGFRVLHQTVTTATLTVDGTQALLTLVQPNEPIRPNDARTGLYHFALLLPKRSDLAHIIAHFVNNGVRFGAADHDISEALYLDDPDGNGIEVYYDRPAEQWTWDNERVHMVTEYLNIPAILEDTTSTWTGLPEGTVMGHIHLSVADLRATEQFYTKGLQYNVVARFGPQALFISTGKYHHHIGLNTWQSANAPKLHENEVGLSSFTVQLNDEQQEKSLKASLQAIGAPIVDIEDGFQTIDPSGNVILLKY